MITADRRACGEAAVRGPAMTNEVGINYEGAIFLYTKNTYTNMIKSTHAC